MADFKQITVGGVSHPVKDEVARQGLAGKQDKLTFDDTPTANSNNPVKSGGVYQAIQDIDVSSQISGKADKSEMSVVAGTGANADKTTITLKSGTSATVLTQHQDISGKQDVIEDLATIRSGAAAGTTAYQKPGTGIPSTDFTLAVQTSLERADEAAVRPYNTQSPDGMGYLVLDKEATFASQVTTANTIYEIRYDYDLNGQTVTLPANCVLKFNGGSLANGTIVFTETLLEGVPSFVNVLVSGTVKNTNLYSKWFDCSDDTDIFTNLASLTTESVGKYVEFEKRTYSVHVNENKPITEADIYTIDLPIFRVNQSENIHINLNGCTVQLQSTSKPLYSIFYFYLCNNFKIENGTIIGDRITHDYSQFTTVDDYTTSAHQQCIGVFVVGSNGTIKGLDISQCCGDAIWVKSKVEWLPGGPTDTNWPTVLIEQCELHHCRRQGISIAAVNYCEVRDTNIMKIGTWDNITGHEPMCGIDVEIETPTRECGEIVLDNVTVTDTTSIGLSVWSKSENDVPDEIEHLTLKKCYIVDASISRALKLNIENSTIDFTKNLPNSVNSAVIPRYVYGPDVLVNGSRFLCKYKIYLFLKGLFNDCDFKGENLDDTNAIYGSHVLGIGAIFNRCTFNDIIGNSAETGHSTGALAKKTMTGFAFTKNATTDAEGVSSMVEDIDAEFKDCVLGNSGFVQVNTQTLVFERCEINTMFASTKDTVFKFCNITDAYGPASGTTYSCILKNCVVLDTLTQPSSGANCKPLFGTAVVSAENSSIELNNSDSIVYPSVFRMKAKGCRITVITKDNRPYSVPSDNLELDGCELITSFPISVFNGKLFNCTARNTSGVNLLPTSGTFATKPDTPDIGFKYFCTDKQTTEGATNGIEIIHKGNDVWVDALGRVVS